MHLHGTRYSTGGSETFHISNIDVFSVTNCMNEPNIGIIKNLIILIIEKLEYLNIYVKIFYNVRVTHGYRSLISFLNF